MANQHSLIEDIPMDSSGDSILLSSRTKDQLGRPSGRAGVRSWVTHSIMFCFGLLLSNLFSKPMVHRCAEKLSIYSPALEAIQYRKILFNGTLTYPSVYRGPPTPELDAAWDSITTVAPISITADELSRIGKTDRPSLVKLHDQDGGGYVAALEFVHQLHCLNMLRKHSYPDYYEPEEDPDIYRTHLDHCVEMLRQQLMCTGDVGLITFDWVEGHAKPYPDFSTWHQCRDFEKLSTWYAQHTTHIPIERSTDAIALAEAA